MPLYLGVDIGGTKTAVVAGDESAKVIARVSFPTDHAGGPEKVIADVKEGMKKVCGECGVGPGGVEAVGISCGGPLDSRRGVVLGPPNLPGWDEVPVVAELSGFTGRPAYLENDANAGAVAEWRYGAGRGTRNMIFVTAGTGFGAGIIVDGRLYSGTNDMAGEIGHVRLEKYGPYGYGKVGSVDALCGGAGVAQVAAEMMDAAEREGRQSMLFCLRRAPSARDVAEAAARGDALAKEILERVGEYWGRALAILVDVLNPQRIVIGSLAVRTGELIMGPARRMLGAEALSRSAEVCEVVPAQLGDRLGDIAALCVAMRIGRQ